VQALFEVGGQAEIDRLLRADDIGTSERLIDVLSSSPTSAVDAYGVAQLPDGARSADGDIGAITWFQALAPSVGTQAAIEALVGYDDDAFVMVEGVDRRCGRFQLIFDTPQDAQSFAEVGREVISEADSSALQQVSTEVEWEICSPIGDPSEQRLGTIMPLVVAHE